MDRFGLAVFNTQPPHLYFGGVERRIIETAKRLQTSVDVTVYGGTKAGFHAPAEVNGVKFVPCKSTDWLYPLDNWTFNRTLTKQAPNIKADIYEAHADSGYGFPKTLKKSGINKPFVHVVHGVLADEYLQAKQSGYATFRDRMANVFMRHLAKQEKQTARAASLVVTISRYSLEKIQAHYGVEPDKVRIVPNGVDTQRFKPQAATGALRRQFGLTDAPCILFVGSLIPRKGLPPLVEAAKKVVAHAKDSQFVIVGEGPLKNQLTATLKEARLLGNFKFLGNIKEDMLPEVYNCADVFVLPSIQEGQGIVLLEAQACGKPVVAFDIGGVNEAVCSGETGLLVPRGNADGLADGLIRLLLDKDLRASMGERGRGFVVENFTWEHCAQGMLGVYREALNR